ncbi:MAG: diacylglycerol kinase family protein [Gemmatimonadaceae bacterium]|nr:diacylglycerol kinase family protein [Gemmatimonadaceae bacterium]
MAVLTARTALLVNPVARRATGVESAVLQAFLACGVTPTVEHTRAAGDGVRAARELAAWHDHLFVLGGDGTVMEAATGIAEAGGSMPIGILPAGTGNQLARALSISLSPRRAVAQLLAGTDRRIDLGILNGSRRVGIGAGLGLDAAMIAGAHGSLKRRLGPASYVVSGTAAALRPRRFAVRAEVDGRVIERECTVAMVLNLGRIFNGLLEVAPGSSLVDGLLDLVIVDSRSLADALSFSVSEMLLRRRHADSRWTFARGRAICIETLVSDIPSQVDGDLIDDKRLSLEIAPLAVRLFVPVGARII